MQERTFMNRPFSMTSYGQGEYKTGNMVWIAEIRSLNHRHCDIHIKMSHNFIALEDKIRKKIGQKYSRGRIDVIITMRGESDKNKSIIPDIRLAKEYHQCLLQINSELGLNDKPSLEQICKFPEIITSIEPEQELTEIWQAIELAIEEALENGLNMRAKEGNNLKQDLLGRMTHFSEIMDNIKEKIPILINNKERSLKERLTKLIKDIEMDPIRLSQEVAIITDKSDVTEEIVRLDSHLRQFAGFLDLDEPVGRRLDFLLQEILREINTMASKINDSSVAHLTVELKNEMEKMREQVQNLE
jgi:uncharacterized protein (TIGR00255 family)